MSLICYTPRAFRADALRIIAQANEIIESYRAQGYDLTLRQLYYQFVSRDLIANKQSEYSRLGSIVSDARRAGMIPWDAIVDRTRALRSISTWDTPSQIIDSAAASFRRDLWENQPEYVEVWFEKDALAGVFERACNQLRVPFFSCRGYGSDSELWAAGQRLKEKVDAGKEVTILHFGDHDPSGLDMTRDVRERLQLFGSDADDYDMQPGDDPDSFITTLDVTVKRLALTMQQVRRYNPPPNPAKMTDSRFGGYAAEYGMSSWELDALDPTVLGDLVRDNVDELIRHTQWQVDLVAEQHDRATLAGIARNYDHVETFVAEKCK